MSHTSHHTSPLFLSLNSMTATSAWGPIISACLHGDGALFCNEPRPHVNTHQSACDRTEACLLGSTIKLVITTIIGVARMHLHALGCF
jgi:hypothetical protein